MSEVKAKQGAKTELEWIKMTVVDENGNTDVREMLSVIKPDADGNLRYMIRLLSPENVKGVTLLTLEKTDGEDEQWFYLPALGTPRKITGSQKSGYFLGSDFTYEDLNSENPEEHEYYRLMDDEVEGREVYAIMSAPAGLDVKTASGYANRLLYIDKETLEIAKMEFYDEGKTEPSKIFEAEDFKGAQVDGPATRPGRVTMKNKEKKTHSIMTLVKSRLDTPVAEVFFDPEALKEWEPEQDKTLISAFDSNTAKKQ
ncbi:outer membrane lipoprotein-sorting protein [Rubellicoccus peritrichatus]|uniref:Outer membrane lipoprotein-sorting protein n=1 Tax=Rubellicoccus peritrichatus TaxID=3080537 RepID=A0AAQ3L6Q2_9BACT|nr:outer membrane lipoprotein-sorting protein [Puniceicoccus sp. CR14]WOO40340.1 outer membrane lipoprotein-sorting protein [Puniceicoccus sp. CR14]